MFFVNQEDHVYLRRIEEREEGGTPDIIGGIRSANHLLSNSYSFSPPSIHCLPQVRPGVPVESVYRRYMDREARPGAAHAVRD